MESYPMHEVEIVAPMTTNAGEPSNYPQAVRDILTAVGQPGWTETRTVGAWHGKLEQGVTFAIYVAGGDLAARTFCERVAPRLRRAMPDQEAIQVAVKGGVILYEA